MKISLKKFVRKKILEKGNYLVVVNEYGNASFIPITTNEAQAVIGKIGERGY